MSKSLKILYAASTASHLKRFHRPYIQALRERYDVRLMATQGEEIDFPIPFAKSFFSPSNLRSVFQIRKILKREAFDAIIVHTTLAAFLIRLATFGIRKRPRIFNVVHGYLFPLSPKCFKDHFLLLCEKILAGKTDALAVMNKEDWTIATQNRLSKSPPVFMKGMGVDLPRTLPQKELSLRTSYVGDTEDLLCLFVGELSNRKNQLFLIRAIKQLREQGVPVRLLLLGEGSAREALVQEIRSLSLEDSVFMPGNKEPIFPYLAIADFYVSASRSEGLPFNVMEAMHFGLPIIASATKGQTDLLEETIAKLYPLEDVDAFCRCVEEYRKDGSFGMGACMYPNLETYRLASVFEENLSMMTEVIDNGRDS